MDQQHAIDRLVGQGQGKLIGQADLGQAFTGPANHPLGCRCKSHHPFCLAMKDTQVWCRVTKAHQAHAGDIGPQRPDACQHQPSGDLAQTAAIKRIEIGDILVHQWNSNMPIPGRSTDSP